jgi:S-adenosylmethionine:tRNA ribosyltransferase-isomerase
MKLSDLKFDYPESLVATEPQRPSRVLWVENESPSEIAFAELLKKIPVGDVLVLNNTKVLRRRVFAGQDLEILFLSSDDRRHWEVLFPSRKYKIGDEIELPLGQKIKLLEKGRPQKVLSSEELTEDYFQAVAELPLPPYIQKARGTRHAVAADESWYQTAWAQKMGSFAAPTASLHFSAQDIEALRASGVRVLELTLHVGLGTFLPVTAEDLDQHEMHSEYFEIPPSVWSDIQVARLQGRKIWALGTTVTRALEGSARSGRLNGFTQILLQPGAEFQIVDRLLTNFHQPESTLLALVYAFAGQSCVQRAYGYAIERAFRLFSYGDLSVWIPKQK